ncbi:hypothetical protein [Mucilaginibacter sp.]|uniref:hypothetical protein n=1 Tax=Mucilaginibacter sp. TaxID=1882438 RepID=UPI002619438D|nr:hypothetical protein [Mucilaginibacter sp.]MDB4925373.1 hypothetical protein [Mucilaginibacter sp.]
MGDIEIYVGDYVWIDEEYFDEDGDGYLLTGTVIDIDQSKKELKVSLNMLPTDDISFMALSDYGEDDFEDGRWFPFNKMKQVERQYKVLDITDSYDDVNNKPVTIAKMSKIIKSYLRVAGGYRLFSHYSHSSYDVFILTKNSNAYTSTVYNTVEKKIINFENFELGFSVIDGVKQKTYYDKPDEPYHYIIENYNDNED